MAGVGKLRPAGHILPVCFFNPARRILVQNLSNYSKDASILPFSCNTFDPTRWRTPDTIDLCLNLFSLIHVAAALSQQGMTKYCPVFSCWLLSCCRLVELAPQYFLGNLPSSDGKELLIKLRQSLEPHTYEQDGMSDTHSRTHRDGDPDGTEEAHNESSTELCVVQ